MCQTVLNNDISILMQLSNVKVAYFAVNEVNGGTIFMTRTVLVTGSSRGLGAVIAKY